MSLPTSTDVLTLDYSTVGMPFGSVPAKATIDTTTMDYCYIGMPFVTNPAPSEAPTNTTSFFQVF